jgi:shikimate dehydrogenase
LPFLCKDLKGLFEFAPHFGIRGFSLTHPFKEEVIPLLSRYNDDVRLLNACNTVFFNGESWEGINTDVDGARVVLQKIDAPLARSRVILLGAGGAAKAIASLLAGKVKELTVLNRTQKKALEIAKQFGAKSGSLLDFKKFDYDILIQATSVGLHSEESAVDPGILKAGKVVIDLIYNPEETALLKKAQALGCKIFNGTDWFDAQAEAQYQWWKSRRSGG